MELAAELAEFMGHCCAEKGNKGTTIADKLVATIFYHAPFIGLSTPLGKPLIRSALNREGARREGYSAESTKAMDVGYTDENAEQRPILGGRGKAGVDRLGVILCFYVAGIGTVLGGEEGVP